MDDDKAHDIVSAIADKIFNEVKFGFNPEVLDVLSNLDSTEKEIEVLKGKIDNDILARLFSIANSVYFGQMKRGKVETFYEVVTRLGMDFTRLIIIFIAKTSLSQDESVKSLYAKSFATSVLAGKLLACECSLTYDDAKKVEMGGLLFEIGRIIFSVYRALYPEEYEHADINERFIDEYQPYLGSKFVEHYKFSDYLKDIVSTKYLTLGPKLITLAGIVLMANSMADYSFTRFGKLVLVSPLPDREGNLVYTTGWAIEGMFKAVGLSKYIQIVDASKSI